MSWLKSPQHSVLRTTHVMPPPTPTQRFKALFRKLELVQDWKLSHFRRKSFGGSDFSGKYSANLSWCLSWMLWHNSDMYLLLNGISRTSFWFEWEMKDWFDKFQNWETFQHSAFSSNYRERWGCPRLHTDSIFCIADYWVWLVYFSAFK